MINGSKKPVVTLEDLLRMKRAERPAPEFWSEFDRVLRVKQLAAIVEPRPWWAPFIRAGARFSRYQLPVGVTAILALSFVTIREYRTTDVTPTFNPGEMETITVPATIVDTSAKQDLAASESRVVAPTKATAPIPAEAKTTVGIAQTGRISHTIQLPTSGPASTDLSSTPSALYIAANLAAMRASDPSLVDGALGNPTQTVASREPVRDPLSQIGTPRESRRSRFLGTALPVVASSSGMSSSTSDRVARRLTEDRLYDTISRVGVKGDRVAIKF